MQPQDVVFQTGQNPTPDVGRPQADNLGALTCHSGQVSDIVATGRTQAASMLNRGRARACVSVKPQERWSRGCRRADVSFWSWLWLQRWLPVPRRKKKSSWSNRSRLNRPIPANTSNRSGRAGQHAPATPAPNIALPLTTAVEALHLQIVICTKSSYPWPAVLRITETSSCAVFPSCHPQLPQPFWSHPVRQNRTRSFPTRFMTSSAVLRPSASGMTNNVIQTAPCRPCPAAKTAASRANGRHSPRQDNGRSAREFPKTTTGPTIRRAAQLTEPVARSAGLAIWAWPANGPMRPVTQLLRRQDIC